MKTLATTVFVQPFGLNAEGGSSRIFRSLLEGSTPRIIVHGTQKPPAIRSGREEEFIPDRPVFGRLENTQTPVSADVIREWCGSAARITVRPVIDLNGAVNVEQYEVPDRIKQRTRWTDPRCVYPHCNRPADRCDCDHIRARDG